MANRNRQTPTGIYINKNGNPLPHIKRYSVEPEYKSNKLKPIIRRI